MNQPLILTVQLDETAQTFYDDLRRRYFPPERNQIPAHLTLFHHLRDDTFTYQTVSQIALATSPSPLTGPLLKSLGHGVAVFFQSAALCALHAQLSLAFGDQLIPQDRQRLRPHIVVQNKVDPETARDTLHHLKGNLLIEPHAIGLTVWRYLGGPWERLSNFPFQGPIAL